MRPTTTAGMLLFCMFPLWASGQTLSDLNLQVETVLSGAAGLSQPTGLCFLGADPNDFFAIEKATGLVKRFQNGAATTVLDLPVESEAERGLLGIALHPNFGQMGQPNNDKVYLYYSRSSTGSDSTGGHWLENRLSRFQWDGASLSGEQALATFGRAGDGRSSGPNHNGGPIKFGPDGMLYGVIGDLNRRESEQNNQAANGRSARTGGIFRLTDSGGIPASNPFVNDSNTSFRRWYAYGVRNSFGLDFDPATGRLWDTENGPTSYDEINRVTNGFNSGWTDIMGPDSRSSGSVGGLVNLGSSSTYADPKFSWKTPIAVTSINFLFDSDLGAAYDDKVLVGDAIFGNLYLFTLNSTRTSLSLTGSLADRVADNTTQRNQLRIGQGFGIVTDLVRGPDDSTYVLNFAAGEVYRISPAGTGSLVVVHEPASIVLVVMGCCAAMVFRTRFGSVAVRSG